ncbi:MAG: tetratricopeptide repeat protein [Trichodesmium sp. St18_bin1]|nr:tetratricopeptide repeat protein [Trichodesmium sp. St18_bin1]
MVEVLNQQGKIDEAINNYKLALKIKPDFPQATVNLQHLLD